MQIVKCPTMPMLFSIFKMQSNLVNSKSKGLEILFLIIESSNYREVDISIYNPQNDYYQFFP